MRQVVTLGVISALSVGTATLSPLPVHATSDTASPASASPASTSPASTSPAAETPSAASPTVDEPVAARPTVDEPVAEAPAPVSPAPAEPVATTPAAEAPIIASPAPSADQILAEAMRATLGEPLKGLVDHAKDVEALRAFYAARNNAPVFVRPDGATEKMRAAIARIKAADQDGLNAGDYPTPASDGNSPEKLVRAELSLMASALKYARHAQAGRTDPSRISVNIAFTPPVPDSLQVLNTISDTADVAAALDSFNPPHAGFKELRTKLRELRAEGASAHLDRAKSGSTKPVSAKPDRQRPDRQKAERAKPESAIETVIANMERWRWLPRDLGENHVIVNIPDYTLSVMRGGQRTFHTRIVVGKKDTPSPVFSDEIESVQVNPTWHVPPAILARNPGLVGRGDFVVSRRADGSVGASQRPGPQNALGQIKVNFPNPFLVYLHDTPDKNLFKLDKRAYSSGCMRVENPDQFAAQVLSIGAAQGNNYTPAQLKNMYNKGERVMSLATRVPIYLVYMNAYVADGQLVVKPDLYDYDARVKSALKGRYIVVQERSQRGSSVSRAARPVSPPQQYQMGQWPGSNGQRRSFFGLF
jgi:murein L,D-transpeptidase YcbB/YkuD